MKYKHLTAADRRAIEVLLNEKKYTQEQIAVKVKTTPSRISRELMRCPPGAYDSDMAHTDYLTKRRACRMKPKCSDRRRQKHIAEKLQVGWSPEQIAGRLKRERSELYVCPETIYQFIYTDTFARSEHLNQYLRYGRKKRKKQTGRSPHRSKIPNRVSIHERPDIVTTRTQYGHAESDSVIYLNKQAINTVNELMTGKVHFTKLTAKTAALTGCAMVQAAQVLGLLSYTTDNGSEFTLHEEVTKDTGVPVYFADPYCSNQRGSNENGNMLLRGYLPKRADISTLTQEELDDIAEELNTRPRKRLAYMTPNEYHAHILSGGPALFPFTPKTHYQHSRCS